MWEKRVGIFVATRTKKQPNTREKYVKYLLSYNKHRKEILLESMEDMQRNVWRTRSFYPEEDGRGRQAEKNSQENKSMQKQTKKWQVKSSMGANGNCSGSSV